LQRSVADRPAAEPGLSFSLSRLEIANDEQKGGISLKHRSLIAVVDDDQSVREALENLISSVGLEVRLFVSAEEFLDSDAPLQTDCAVLDLRLPGISGLELQRKLVADGQSIPAIIITAEGDDKARAEAVAAGVVAFLKKPFGEEVLLAAIDSALKQKLDDQVLS
jgi:FixJ family two-component response regulator